MDPFFSAFFADLAPDLAPDLAHGRAPLFGRAPARVNLIGEHIDYNGGLVLPMALPMGIDVALAPLKGDVDLIASDRFSQPGSAGASDGNRVALPLDHVAQGHWSDHAAGALQKARQLGWIQGAAGLAIKSLAPHGAGLSSSAALIVAILKAARELSGYASANGEALARDNQRLALAAQKVEHEYLGVPCGIMDQMVTAMAQPGEVMALDCRGPVAGDLAASNLAFEILALPRDWRIAILHSGIERRLDDGRYKERRDECEAARLALAKAGAANGKLAHLCLVPHADWPLVDALPDTLRKRALHAIREHHRSLMARDAILDNDVHAFARGLNEAHRSLSEDFAVSLPQIDALVADAVAGAGALAARLTGGGFGGAIVVLLPPSGQADFDPQNWLDALLAKHPQARLIWMPG